MVFFSAPLAIAQVADGAVVRCLSAWSSYENARELAQTKSWGAVFETLKPALTRGALIPGFLSLYSRAAVLEGKREDALLYLSAAWSTGGKSSAVVIGERIQILSRIFLTAESAQRFEEGRALLEAGKTLPAADRFQQLLAVEPGNVEVLLRLAQARILDGQAEAARELLLKAKRFNPVEPEISLWLGRALFLRGRHQAGIEELRRARRGIKESEHAAIWLAEAMAGAGQRTGAIQVLEQDLKYFPQHLQVLIQVARYRLLFFDHDIDMIWSARKEVQLGLSRLALYRSEQHPRTESEFGIQLGTTESIRSSLQTLMEKIETRLARVE